MFLSNGGEHTPKAAADHLRSKWAAKADEITTASRFIGSVLREHLADIEREK